MRKLIPFLIAIALIGCGKAKETAQNLAQRVEAPEIMHTWGGKCEGSQLLGLSMRTFYQFSGNKIYEQKEFYKAGDCNAPASATVKYTGDFDLQGDSTVVKGAKDIHIRWQTAATSSTDDIGKKFLAVYPLMKVPADEYNIVKADSSNKVLYLGEKGLGRDLSKPTERPAKLADKSPLYEVDKDLSH